MFIVVFILGLVLSPRAWADDVQTSVHLQSTVVSQEHGAFPSAYAGQNSLSSSAEQQTSTTITVFTGLKWGASELYVDPELAGGSGFNHTTGIAGFPNGEIYRVDDPSPKWNLARLYYKRSFGLGGEAEQVKDEVHQLPGAVRAERLTVILGKFALNDFIDTNTYSHDPRTQFLNWGFMDNGAWDYAADTRGYSWGLFLEYNVPKWAVRFASVMVPIRANQLEMQRDFPKYRGDNLEFEYRTSLYEQPGAVRLLVYENHADMGSYRETLDQGPAGGMDVTKTRSLRTKYGVGLSLEQALSEELGAFFRLSWNDGKSETWNFTEIDRAASGGVALKGRRWNRAGDTVGLGVMVNGLSAEHRDYLANGGYGFMIGDGKLTYAPEEIAELYYSLKIMTGVTFTGDYQFVNNPGYNSDRGPVSIASMRLHWEI